MGRPSKYTDALALTICKRIAEGESLRKICVDAAMPTKSTVLKWALTNDEFSDHYAKARGVQADVLFDGLMDLADEATPADYQVKRLQVDTRKWSLSKMLPKKYGDKQAVEVTGAEGGPVQIVNDKSFDGL